MSPASAASYPHPDTWRTWPDGLRPDGAPSTWNTPDIDAPRERVWAHLVRAQAWPECHANAGDVRERAASGPRP